MPSGEGEAKGREKENETETRLVCLFALAGEDSNFARGQEGRGGREVR